MALSERKRTEALALLKDYNGNNPYMLRIQKQVYVDKRIDSFKDFQAEFVLNNYDFSPKRIDKIVKLADWYGEKKKEEWGLDFVPQKVKIVSYLGETSTSFVCYAQYRKSVDAGIHFLSKQGVLTNFLAEDYTKMDVDFERYHKLSISMGKERDLFEHQKEAVKFLLSRKKCILADDQGLGKTTSLSVAAIEGNFDSVLIICPASLKYTWRTELSCFIPEKDITVIENFNKKKKDELERFLGYAVGKSNMTREELLKEAEEQGQWKHNRFVIVNYDIVDDFFSNKRTYTKEQFEKLISDNPMLEYINNRKSLIIIDEAHKLSNTKSIRYKTIRGLINKGKPHSIYLATGTVVTNNPANLYCILNLLDYPITSDWEYYMKRYCNAKEFCLERPKRNRLSEEYIHKIGKRNWYDLTETQKKELDNYLHKNCRYVLSPQGESNLEELKERISDIYLRRLKEIIKLPEKEVHTLYYSLNVDEQREYEKLWDEYEKEHNESNIEGETQELNRALLEGAIYRQYLSKKMVPNTIKLAENIIKNGDKVIIACCFDDELYTIKEHFGDKCVVFNGKMDIRQKDDAVKKFMGDTDTKVFVGNIIAAGVGLTLISAHNLIFNDFDYVPGNNFQMEDRIHRIGQTKKCDIYYQIFKDTQYEKMSDIISNKTNTINQIIKKEDEK